MEERSCRFFSMAPIKPSHLPLTALCAVLLAMAPTTSVAQQPDLNQLFEEASKAFGEEQYASAAKTIETILAQVAQSSAPVSGPIEQLRFSLGLAYLLDGKPAEAEKAFEACIKQFPNGEYTSRCYLGIGRARLAADTDEARKKAIDPLRRAAADPKLRTEAGLSLGTVYSQLNQEADALKVFRSLMGSDIRTPAQTIAAVEVVSLLAATGKMEDLVPYLDRLIRQTGVRNAIAWYTNQVIISADELVGAGNYDPALVIYRSILPRNQILTIQREALGDLRKEVTRLEGVVKAEEKLPLTRRTNAYELLGNLKTAVETTEKALKMVEDHADLDAALLMRRGRCLYYLHRYDEALLSFRTIRTKHPQATDIQAAAYAEIAILHELKRTPEIVKLATDYIAKFPDAENAESIFFLVGEALIQEGDWKRVYDWYRGIQEKFPQSANLERAIASQGMALMSDGQFSDAALKYAELLKSFPSGDYAEESLYRIAMCYFLTNDYKNTLSSCKDYLDKYPNGKFAGDILYRLSFIDFQNKEEDKSDEILQNLGTYAEAHRDDAAAGAMFALIGDVWSQKKKKIQEVGQEKATDNALSYYLKAVWSPVQTPDITKYAMDQATSIMMGRKDYEGVAKLHGEFIEKYPDGELAMLSAAQIATVKIRQKDAEGAATYIGTVLKGRIGNPEDEQAENLIDLLLRAVVPKLKRPTEEQIQEVEEKVVKMLDEIVGGNQSSTANARIYYARAKVRAMFKDYAKSDLYLNGIATGNEPSELSPQLLAVCAEMLLKNGDLDKAEEMFKRLRDKYQNSFFSDAGPVGLGRVALARDQGEEALTLLDVALENKSSSRMYEAMEAKVRALMLLNKLDDAEKLALEVIGTKQAGRELIAKSYLNLAQIARLRAKAAAGEEQRNLLISANSRYERVMTAYKSVPEAAADAFIGRAEVLREMNNNADADATLDLLIADPKFEKTAGAKKARQLRGK
jgi:tetratricopeptide (TPR) repeat protein